MNSVLTIPVRQATPLPGLLDGRAERVQVHVAFRPWGMVVQADLSACDPETIQVAISCSTLLIVAQRRKSHSVQRTQSLHRRLPEKAFVGRMLVLPIEPFAGNTVSAHLAFGLLRVTIPITHSACVPVAVELPDAPRTDVASHMVPHHRTGRYPGPQRRLKRVRRRPDRQCSGNE